MRHPAGVSARAHVIVPFSRQETRMIGRRLVTILAAMTVVLAAAVAFAQTQGDTVKAISAQLMMPARGFVQPKTEWGEPDISGVWTSDAALGIPRERPVKYGNRGFYTDQEFADVEKADKERRSHGENAVGAFRNDDAWKTKSFRQTSLVIEPQDGHTPPFTTEALTRTAPRDRGSFGEGPFDSWLDFTLYDRCITRGIVGSIMPVVYGNGNRIVQTPGQVVISYEMIHDTRVIYTDGRPHVSRNIRQYLGDSRGHWEGNTLVIETTNFTDQTSIGGGNGNGLRHSTEMKITERITRIDKDELRYEVHVDDPKTYTKPFTISLPLTSPPGYELLPYDCHEGNYMLPHSLSAEREEDRAIEDDAKRGIIRKRKSVQQNLDAGARPIPGRANPNDDIDSN
jgi:hypothetical protein